MAAEDGGECLSVFGSVADPVRADVCRPLVRANHPLTRTSSVPPMASQLARILSRRMLSSPLGNTLGCLTSSFQKYTLRRAEMRCPSLLCQQ